MSVYEDFVSISTLKEYQIKEFISPNILDQSVIALIKKHC